MSIRRSGSFNRALAWSAVAGLVLTACGGQAEVARGPAPAKMAWGDSPAEATADAPEAAPEAAEEESEPEESGARPGEIDLDAPVAKAAPAPKAKPAPAPKVKPEPVAKAKPEPAAEPEEAVEEEEVATPARAAASADPLALELQKRRDAAKARSAGKDRAAGEGKGKKPAPKKKRAEAAPAATEESGAPRYTGSDPCRASSFSVDRVRDACASGGRAAAKRVMKDAIGKATATGQSLRCTNCHTNQRDYALKPDAVTDLSRWLEGSGS